MDKFVQTVLMIFLDTVRRYGSQFTSLKLVNVTACKFFSFSNRSLDNPWTHHLQWDKLNVLYILSSLFRPLMLL